MNETRKMINWVAGVSTLIVTLLLIIVIFEPKNDQVSRAAAVRAVALSMAGKEEITAGQPENSYFSEELADEWYVKYFDYLYAQGILNPETLAPTKETALSAVTYGDLWAFIRGLKDSGETSEALSGYLTAVSEKKAAKTVGRERFWEFYDDFRAAADPDGAVCELETDIYGTPDNLKTAPAWTAYTKDGRLSFEGLSLKSCIDKTVRLLVRDSEILKVEEIVSSEIVYENAWISGFANGAVTVFIGNITREFPVTGVLNNEDELSGRIADLYLKNGKPNRLVLKNETITGTILSVKDDAIEIEGYGLVPLAANFKIYRTYGVLKEQKKKDILVGYHMQQFVVADGEICAALTTEKPDIDKIRVLIMTDGFSSLYHDRIVLSCDTPAVLEYGDGANQTKRQLSAGESVTVERGDARLANGRMSLRPLDEDGAITVSSLKRGQGTPVYPGHMEITEEADGLLLLNEVDLEEYLKRVVPSEMPQSYEAEALKAQAISARTYAWKKIQMGAYSEFGAHVDDSINYQVYNNMDTCESTDRAVNETYGQVLTYQGEPVETFYYSTSCGYGTDSSIWGSDGSETPYLEAVSINDSRKKLDLTSNETFASFIKKPNPDDYEAEFPMYRWSLTTTSEILAEKIGGVGRITGLTITERGPGGDARTLKVVGTEGTKTFHSQNRIRSVLGSSRLSLKKNDGSTADNWETLPSAFLYIENSGTDSSGVTTFVICGGGYGHGVGLSQNGAQGMAKRGKSAAQILQFFYRSCEIMDVEELS